MHDRYVTDILKMHLKNLNAEKLFLTNLQSFDLHIAGGGDCKPCLQPISCFISKNYYSIYRYKKSLNIA